MIRSPIRSPLSSAIRSAFEPSRGGINIAALFGAYAGREGVYYGAASDPSITAMIAENRKALGPELVENAEFANDISGWSSTGTGVPSWVDGRLRRTSPGGSGGSYRDIPVTPGKPHWIETSIRLVSGAGAFGLWAYNGAGFVNPLVGSFTQGGTIVVPTTNVMRIYLYSDSVSVCDFDRASVREIADWSKLIAFADPFGTVPLLSVHQADRGFGLLLDRSKGLIRGADLLTDKSSLASGASRQVLAAGANAYKWLEIENTVTGLSLNDGISTRTLSTPRCVIQVQAGAAGAVSLTQSTGSAISLSSVTVKELPGNHYVQPTATARGEITARVNDLIGTAALATQSITTIAAQRRLSFSGAGTITLSGAATGVYSAGSHVITCTAGTLTHTVAGSVLNADSRLEADAIPSIPAYQRVGSVATDYDSEGFPVRWRGQTDDFGKARINPNGATKALVMWAGQKLSDAAVGIVVESSSDSSATNGTLALFAPNTAGQPRYMLRSRGTATSEAQDSTHPAPGRDVIRAQTGIATDVADLYVDGALAAQSATDQGTGAYTEQDVFFWSRAGTSQFFNGYASTLPMLLFMQPGDPGLSASQIAQLDKAYAKAVGVTL